MREAGVLLHITSLPGKYGIGTLGKCAYDFVDFLAKSGQKIWQILPIGPTSYGDSPYSSTSAFAFNPFFIDMDMLVEAGLLEKEDLDSPKTANRVDFNHINEVTYKLLHKAYLKFDKEDAGFAEFKEAEAEWLNDYAYYMVIKNECNEKRPWYEWWDDYKYRRDHTMIWVTETFKAQLDEVKFIQYIFYTQFIRLKKYANKKGILIMGDMPIYCAHDSADVWSHPEYFALGDGLIPKGVAGCPPDGFSPLGQLWGNPLYDWDYLKKNKYSFWVKRVKHSFKMYDILRIDHFRGFAGYFNIPYGDKDARGGHWCDGPGYALFKEIKKNLGDVRIVAENLGFLTPDVFKLLKDCKYPGMNIFQFELGYDKICPLKKGFKENNIFYTGTHDNQTLMSFYNSLDLRNKKIVDSVCNIGFYDKPNLKMIEYSMNTKCDMCIIPLQDYLGLDDLNGRMNIPSTPSGNWGYIAKPYDFTKELSDYIKTITKESLR